MRAALIAAAALLLPSSGTAGPKPPTTAIFEPEIVYTYTSGNATDLRLSNLAGTAAILVHRETNGLGLFDVSIEGPNRIAYRAGAGILYLRTWSTNPVTISAAQPIYSGPGFVEGMDFSPDGRELAFTTIGDTSQIFISNLEALGSPPVSVLQTYSVLQVRWDPTDRILYFSGRPKGVADETRVYRLDLRIADDPGTPGDERVQPLFGNGTSFFIFDLSHPPLQAGDERILIDRQDQISLWRTDGSFDRVLFSGSAAHFNCKNDRIIHRAANARRTSTRISDLSGDFVTWSTDSNIFRTDWIPRFPCL